MTIVVLIALFLGCAVGAFYLWRKREANPEAADLVQRIGIGGAEWLAPNLDVEDWLAGKVHRTIHPEKDKAELTSPIPQKAGNSIENKKF